MTISRNRRRLKKYSNQEFIAAERLEMRALLSVTVQNFANINRTNPWADISESVAVGTDLYFVASENNSSSLDLWKSNGTNGGTIRLAHLGPADNQSRQLTNVNGTLYFRGYDSAEGVELWKSNGTIAGTALVRGLQNGRSGSTLTDLTNVNGTLYFSGNGDLYRSNGTSSGTSRVKDLIPGESDEVSQLTRVGNLFYFSAKNPAGGVHLYQTNGTRTGTGRIENVAVDSLTNLTKVGSSLYFVQDSKELWRINEATSTASTVLISPYPNSFSNLVDFGGTLYFLRFNSELMMSDGTTEGTVSVRNIGDSANNLFVSNNVLYFSGGTSYFGNGEELWRSDGTESGTFELKDIEPRFNEGYGYGSYPGTFTESGGQLFFQTTKGLWTTDGTQSGTIAVDHLGSKPVDVGGTLFFIRRDSGGIHLQKSEPGQTVSTEVKRTGPGTGDSNSAGTVVHNGALYFLATDGITGNELRRRNSNGTIELVADITPGPADTTIIDLTSVNGLLYFTVIDSSFTFALWRSDGTSPGTFKLSSVVAKANSSDTSAPKFVAVNDLVYFSGEVGGNVELWKSDGTISGTAVVKDIFPGGTFDYNYGFIPNSSNPANLTNVNGKLFFAATDATGGRELWTSDGIATGTVILKDLRPGANYYYPYEVYSAIPTALTNVNGTLHFLANDGTGLRYFESDGTGDGTVAVSGIIPGLTSVGATKRIGEKLYFVGSSSTVTQELWVGDGTAAGTKLLKDIRPGHSYQFSSQISNMTELDGVLYFTANDGEHGVELWKSDGTTRGTAMVRDLRTGLLNDAPANSNPARLTAMNGVLYFSADDGKNGRELWRTNGAAGGATKIPELVPGQVGSDPGSLTVWNNSLLFSADSTIGRELFRLRVTAPVLTLNSTELTFTEGQLSQAIAPDASLSSSDRTILPGGRLTVSLLRSAVGDELGLVRFAPVEQAGNSVHQYGVVFGMISTLSTSTNLVITFNQNATLARIQALIRSIAFFSTSDNPSAKTRNIRIRLEDGESGIVNRNTQIQVIPVNDKPELSGLIAIDYQRNNSTGVAFAGNVVISDIDNRNFDSGELRISVTGGDRANNLIFVVGNTFSIDLDGNLLRAGVNIGIVTANSGIGTQPFVVKFNSAARTGYVTGLLRALRFGTLNSISNHSRQISISLADGGVESRTVTGNLLVNVTT